MIAPHDDPPIRSRESLVRAARDGDGAALEDLVRAIWPDVFRIAWSVLRNHVAAEDAAQDACAQVAAKITTLRSPEAFTVWLYRTTVRAATRYHAIPLDTLPDDLRTDQPAVEDRLDLGAQIVRLPRDLRIVVVLRYFLDCTSAEIGAILGIPAPTVRFRLAAARTRLRDALALAANGDDS
jgi:RNA polymerase sigma-70 factor (ECF subfamily)